MLLQRHFVASPWIVLMTSSFSQYSNYPLYAVKNRDYVTDDFLLVSHFHCEHQYLRKRIIPPLSPLPQNPMASSYSPSSPSRTSSQHGYLRKRKQIVPPLTPLLQNPSASSYSPSSPPKIYSQHPPCIPEILVLFLSSLVAGSLWNNVRTRCSCSNKRLSSVLFCISSWVVLGCYLCNHYPLYWLCPQPAKPLSQWGFPLFLVDAIAYHSLSNSV